MRYRDQIVAFALIWNDLIYLNLSIILAVSWRYKASFPLLSWPQLIQDERFFLWGILHLTIIPALMFLAAYKNPRRWALPEALVTIGKALLLALLVTTLLMFMLHFGEARHREVVTPSRLVLLFVWSGVLVGAAISRLLVGRILLGLYQRGLAVRNCLVWGDRQAAADLNQRLRRNPWLGERIVGWLEIEEASGGHQVDSAEWQDMIKYGQIQVIWLVPPRQITADWLPASLFETEANHLIWRILPHDFERLMNDSSLRLTSDQRHLLFRRLRRDVDLPVLRVAMIGSRGIPANYSGVEKYIEAVGCHLVMLGAQVTVYCHEKYVTKQRRYCGMKLMFMPTINTKHLETIIHTFLSTCHALLQGNDVFHYHALGPTTLAWLPRLFGCKVVTTVQGLDWERAKWGPVARAYLKFGEWTTVKFPHATIVVSRTLAQHYAVKYQKSTIHIPNGFEPPIQRCPSLIKDLDLDQDNYILFVGRLSPEKGCHTLIHAFRQVETDKHLVLAGRANYDDDYYQQLRAEANGSAKIHFVGFVQGAMLQELYSNAYLVVHPSECEGLSVSLLEALSYNHCVLVSNIPENIEVLPSRGYTFQVGNQRDLAQQLQKLFDNPGQVVSSRRFIQAHTDNLWPWEKVGQATYEVYEALLN